MVQTIKAKILEQTPKDADRIEKPCEDFTLGQTKNVVFALSPKVFSSYNDSRDIVLSGKSSKKKCKIISFQAS